MNVKITFCVLFILLNGFLAFSLELKERVKLSSITILSFKKDVLTNANRLSPRPQLQCVNGRVDCKYELSRAQCRYSKEKWDCMSLFSKGIKFGQINVNCEGFDFDNDKYILKGSCALLYTLDFDDDKVKLSRINSLNFSKDAFANRKRLPDSLQLKCLDDFSCLNGPRVASCMNINQPGQKMKVACEAELPKNAEFRQLNINCEGYSSDKDEYILRDSCVLEFSLKIGKNTEKSFSLPPNFLFYCLIAIVCFIFMVSLAFRFMKQDRKQSNITAV